MRINRLKIIGVSALSLMISPAMAIDPVIVVEGAQINDSTREVSESSDIKLNPSSDGAELLRSVPGISGSRMGGRGIDPIIRGQSQNRLNILIDGAYVHGGCPNRMDPPTAYTATDAFDEVTIIKGSQTVVYGGGGPGGTVLFDRVTPRFYKDEGIRAHVAGGYRGNSNTTELSADVSAGNPDGYIRGMASYMDAGNYKDGDGNTVRSSFKNREATVMGGLTPDADTRLEFSYQANREDDILFAGAGMDSPYTRNDTWRVKANTDINDVFKDLKFEMYHSDIEHLMDNYSLRVNTGPMNMSSPSTSETLGGRVSVKLLTESGAKWTLGADYQNNDRDAERFRGPKGLVDPVILQSVLWPGVEIKQLGLFAESSYKVSEEGKLKGGLRFDSVDSSAGQTNRAASVTGALTRAPSALYATYYTKGTDNDHDEGNLGGFLTYEHEMNKSSVAYATISRSVRTADATERYIASDSGVAGMRWIGNPHLESEKHHQFEIGYKRQTSDWDVSTSFYYNKVSDYILRDRAHGQSGILLSDNATIYRNIDARLYGFELGTHFRVNKNWGLGATAAYVNSTNTTDSRPIAQTPPFEATFNVDYHQQDWNAGVNLTVQDNQTRVEDNAALDSGLDPRASPGWGVLDVYMQYAFNDDLTFSAGINNLMDKTYTYHVNRANSDPFNPAPVQVNEPGREIWIKGSMEF